tara:strand:- start:103 stop:381 length:279 start_codon:yes stop_codon:yes gene_type:complete
MDIVLLGCLCLVPMDSSKSFIATVVVGRRNPLPSVFRFCSADGHLAYINLVIPARAAKELGHSTEMFLNRYSEFIEKYAQTDMTQFEGVKRK